MLQNKEKLIYKIITVKFDIKLKTITIVTIWNKKNSLFFFFFAVIVDKFHNSADVTVY